MLFAPPIVTTGFIALCNSPADITVTGRSFCSCHGFINPNKLSGGGILIYRFFLSDCRKIVGIAPLIPHRRMVIAPKCSHEIVSVCFHCCGGGAYTVVLGNQIPVHSVLADSLASFFRRRRCVASEIFRYILTVTQIFPSGSFFDFCDCLHVLGRKYHLLSAEIKAILLYYRFRALLKLGLPHCIERQ